MTMRADIYIRLSQDRVGAGVGIANQLADCRAYISSQGWEEGVIYQDNDLSATSGVTRPGFEQLLKDQHDIVVVWHMDRLLRTTKDLERVIELGVNIYAVKAGSLDLSTPAGRMMARVITSFSQYEGEHRTERQRLANRAAAERGEITWSRPVFGYNRDGSINEDEAKWVRFAVEQFLAGKSMRSIASHLNEEGVTGKQGGKWSSTTLKQMLASPTHAGLSQHLGEVVGKGQWEAIVPEPTWRAVQAKFNTPARYASGNGNRGKKGRPYRYLVSGIATCGECGERIWGVQGRTQRKNGTRYEYSNYYCPNKHMNKAVPWVDEYIEAVIVEYLSRAPLTYAPEEGQGLSAVDSLTEEAIQLRQRLQDAAQAYAGGAIDINQLSTITAETNARLGAVQQALEQQEKPPILARILTVEDVGKEWGALGLDQKRSIIAATLRIVFQHSQGRRDLSSIHIEPLQP